MPVTPGTITPLPTPPTTRDPVNFDNRADAFLGALPQMTSEINSTVGSTYNNAVEAAASATAAVSAKTASEAARDQSVSAKNESVQSYSDMQKLYLGPKTSAPTTDNQGNPISNGAWYTNLTDGSWYWWRNNMWNPGVGDISGSYMPISGGNFTGHITVPSGATGNQVPRVNSVMLKAPELFDTGSKTMGSLTPGYALLTSTTGRGPDWPVEGLNATIQTWLVVTTGIPNRLKQEATQILFSESGQIQGSTFIRVQQDSSWNDWDRVITGRTMMSTVVTANVPSGTPTYSLNPAMGGEHVVTVNGTVTFNLPAPRQLGDSVTLHAISAGAIRAIVFSSNVVLPKDSTGAVLPFQQYPANGMATLLFKALRPGQWECYYGGVH